MKTRWLRPILVLGLACVLLVLLMVGIGSGSAQASEPDTLAAPRTAQSAAPTRPAPLSLNPPIIASNPSAAPNPPTGANKTVQGLEVMPFRPQFTVTRGEVPDFIKQQQAQSKSAPQRPAQPDGATPTSSPKLDYSPMLAAASGWNLLAYEGFEGVFPNTLWTQWSGGTSGEYFWEDTSYTSTVYAPQSGLWAAWPGAAGTAADFLDPSTGYTNSMNSWLMYGPVDLTGKTDFFVGFGLWYETEPNFDFAYLCATTDFATWSCADSWSGSSAGWENKAYWLTNYAGASQVWLAWVFASDGSVAGDYGFHGPYLDEVAIWDYTTPPPDPTGQLLLNGGFETGDFTDWLTQSVPVDEIYQPQVLTATYAEGGNSAHSWRGMDGYNYIYQNFVVTPGMESLTINYWYALTSVETEQNRDFFCASVRPQDLSAITVDLGCLDAVDVIATSGSVWQEALFTPDAAQLAALKGVGSVALVFEHYDNGFGGDPNAFWTDLYLDYVRVYATTSSTALDANEPNNDFASATNVTCNITDTYGVIGDVLGGYDEDWFTVTNVPSGPLVIDINARNRAPASLLDSVVTLYDSSFQQVDFNDDDGITADSFISYTVPVTGSTYYFSVQSYTGVGGPEYFYYFDVGCNSNEAPPTGGGEPTPSANTWTVMLYLNAEDPGFEQTLINYRTALEGFIGAKNEFMTVTVLYDGPVSPAVPSVGAGTTRYVLQPSGVYTNSGVDQNRWALGELNMGDPATLQNFVDWSMNNFPAENYYLAIDDHGDGAYGISVDGSSTNDVLTPPEVYSALKGATLDGDPNRKIDILDYEACLMGLTENAYDVRDWANYVVFSQQISWGINTYPVYFSDLAAGDTPLAVGQRIVNRYSAGAIAGGFPHTIALIDTSQLGAVRTAVDSLATALQATSNPTLVRQARSASQAFAADVREATNSDFADYIDLWDFAAETKARFIGNAGVNAAATSVQTAVDNAVVAERHVSGGIRFGNSTYTWDHSGAHGLSLYFPPDKGSPAFTTYVSSAPYLYQMAQDGGWDEFLNWAVPTVPGGGGNGRGGMSSTRVQSRLSSGATFVTIPLYLPLIRR